MSSRPASAYATTSGGDARYAARDLRMDAAFEVAVAAEHRGDREILGVDALRDELGQRPAVADARGAPVTDEVEAQLLQRAEQARALEVIGDHA